MSDNDRPSWDEYFMDMAELAKTRSRDPKCQVGAVIVREEDNDNIVLATGYNGLARGVLDLAPRILGDRSEKLCWMCHAETNAIYNAARLGVATLKGATMYVTKFPCMMCANAIIQVGLKRIYTLDTEPWQNDPLDDDGKRTKRVLSEAGIKVVTPNFNGEPAAGKKTRKKKKAAANRTPSRKPPR